MNERSLGWLILFLLLALPAATWWRGCSSPSPPIHPNPNMDRQPKYRSFAPSSFFASGSTSQPAVEGTLARGELLEDEAYATGRSVWTGPVSENPVDLGPAEVERGAERYEIFCTPCHGSQGDGQSALTVRTGIRTADLRSKTTIGLRDGELFRIISQGQGLMRGYKALIPIRDRWLITAHIRRLQGTTVAASAEGTPKEEAPR